MQHQMLNVNLSCQQLLVLIISFTAHLLDQSEGLWIPPAQFLPLKPADLSFMFLHNLIRRESDQTVVLLLRQICAAS